MAIRKNVKDYEYSVKSGKYFDAIFLKDKTAIVLHKKKKKMCIFFPKEKFSIMFSKQIKDRSRDRIGVCFSYIELCAIEQGLNHLLKRKK